MYFCLRRRERRYRNFLKGIPRPRPRALGENPSEEREDSAEGDVQNNESVDSAVPQPVQSSVDDYYKHSKDFKMLLHAKCVKKNGKIAYMSRSFRIVCVYVSCFYDEAIIEFMHAWGVSQPNILECPCVMSV